MSSNADKVAASSLASAKLHKDAVCGASAPCTAGLEGRRLHLSTLFLWAFHSRSSRSQMTIGVMLDRHNQQCAVLPGGDRDTNSTLHNCLPRLKRFPGFRVATSRSRSKPSQSVSAACRSFDAGTSAKGIPSVKRSVDFAMRANEISLLLRTSTHDANSLQHRQLCRSCSVQLQRDHLLFGEEASHRNTAAPKTRQSVSSALAAARQQSERIRV